MKNFQILKSYTPLSSFIQIQRVSTAIWIDSRFFIVDKTFSINSGKIHPNIIINIHKIEEKNPLIKKETIKNNCRAKILELKKYE